MQIHVNEAINRAANEPIPQMYYEARNNTITYPIPPDTEIPF